MNWLVAFDLDDTLYDEKDYVDSAFNFIADTLSANYPLDKHNLLKALHSDGNPFDSLMSYIATTDTTFDKDIAWLVNVYRTHRPTLSLPNASRDILNRLQALGTGLTIITDGRLATQSLKIEALGLKRWIKDIYISEAIGYDKSSRNVFDMVMHDNPECRYAYIGDNPAKDFLWPNRLGWTTIALRDTDGTNIHPQSWETFPNDYRPQYIVDDLRYIFNILFPHANEQSTQ